MCRKDSMLHASTWLGYSWDLVDLSDSARALTSNASHGVAHVGNVTSRRDKFRSAAGPSRDELQWLQILSILRKVRVPSFLLGSGGGQGNGESATTVEKGSFSNASTMTSTSREFIEVKLKDLLEDLSWPFAAVSQIDSFEITWESVPNSADPMRGSGYKNGVDSPELKCDPVAGHENCCRLERGERKRLQVGNIASALSSFQLQAGSRIVDFGCGSGALTLPLAALFPQFCFVGVDFKQQSISLLQERARRANLHNVVAFHERIENFSEPFDACVALHACGIATDLALLQALKHRAAYVMSPCCIGKLQLPLKKVLLNSAQHVPCHEDRNLWSTLGATTVNSDLLGNDCTISVGFTNGLEPNLSSLESLDSGGQILTNLSSSVNANEASEPKVLFCRGSDGACQITQGSLADLRRRVDSVRLKLVYPRSRWLRSSISEKDFRVLARAADWSSYDYESFASRLHSLCKIVLELDRNEASRELGYCANLFSLSNEKAGIVGVSHILVGKP